MGTRLVTWTLKTVFYRSLSQRFFNLKSLGRHSQEDWNYCSVLRSAAEYSSSVAKCLSSQYKSETAEKMENTVTSESPGIEDGTAISELMSEPSESVKQPERVDNAEAKPLSKRALKRMARAQKHKEIRKQKKAETLLLTQREDAGYSLEDLDQSSYYFENELRKVYPYNYVFATHAKGRWVGRTIQDVLEREFGFDRPGDLARAFESNMIHVNSRPATSDYILRDNDYISHRTHRHENPVTSAPIEVIEDSDDLVVINKPSSIPCHPCGRYRFNSVVFILGKEMGLTNLRNIYRLDRLTSGVLILGKSAERTRVLMDQVAKRQVQKEYVCRVVGKFPDGTVKVDQPLRALSNKLRLQVISPKGKPSQTTFTRVSYNGKSSVVRCVPHTGRTHQIRVHLQYLGHPIINDAFYNNEAWGPSKGKNGIYEVPHDKVCERILTEHHVTLWDGGDNPLYYQKLKEMETEKLHVADSNETSSENLKGGNSSPIKSDMVSEDQDNSWTSSTLGNEPPEKRRKKEAVFTNVTSEVDNENANASLKSSDRTCPVSMNSEKTECVEVQPDCHEKERQSLNTESTDVRDLSFTSSERKTDCLDQRPVFEMSKWSVDLSCELCKRKPVDPEEKHLVMFLHAIKYKGPGWEYTTELPDWAKEDWNREEEYAVTNMDYLDS